MQSDIFEEHNFPVDTHINYHQTNFKMSYRVINVGDYNSNCVFTRNKVYKVPDNYVIESTYGKLLTTVQCSIKYDKNKPIYKIKWDNKTVESSKTPTDVTNKYLMVINFIKSLV